MNRGRMGKLVCLGVALIAVLLALLLHRPDGTGEGNETAQSSAQQQTSQDTQAAQQTQHATEQTVQPTQTTQRPATQTEPSETEPAQTLTQLQLPLELEGGLVLENLFQYSGLNPDHENREGENIASATLKNTSGEHLTQALVAVTLTDGSIVTFKITDLPAGATVMAFSREQASMGGKVGCHAVSCTVSMGLEAPAIPEQVTVAVTGATVTLTNQTDRPLTNLVIYCRNILGTEYFGGVTYQYTIENIPAHATVTLEAEDCILGLVDVVRVEMSQD